MIANEFVDQNDLAIDAGGQCIRQSKQLVLWIVLDAAYILGLLVRGKVLVVLDSLQEADMVRAAIMNCKRWSLQRISGKVWAYLYDWLQ